MKRPPYLLIAGCALYLLIELWILATGFDPSRDVAIRIAITLVLFFFVLRGSRAAGIIWGICNLLGGLMVGVAAVLFMSSNSGVASLLLLAGLLALGNAAYLFFSPTVRAFQRVALPLPR